MIYNLALVSSIQEGGLVVHMYLSQDSPVSQPVKNLPAMQETRVRSLGAKNPPEKEMATHSSIFAWRIPWTEEPGRLESMGSQESDTDLATKPAPPPYVYPFFLRFFFHIGCCRVLSRVPCAIYTVGPCWIYLIYSSVSIFSLIFFGVNLLYSVVFVSALQQSESVVCVHISPLFGISSPFRSPKRTE